MLSGYPRISFCALIFAADDATSRDVRPIERGCLKTALRQRIAAMWVWLDSAGPILFDATLSTALFLSLVVLAMLVCRQPTRRLLIARVALLASLAMIPLVALVPLPRLDLLDTLVQSDLLPTSLIVELEKSRTSNTGFDRARARLALAARDMTCTTHSWEQGDGCPAA